MKTPIPSVLFLSVLCVASTGCSKQASTEKILLDWANVLNVEVTSPDHNYEYPESLDLVDETLRLALSDTDAWGHEIRYRKLSDAKYQVISPGPDGQVGNEDDVIVENGLLQKAETVYAERPWA